MARRLKIIHVSDLHITDGSHFVQEAFEQGVGMVNSLDADLVVCSGDAVHQGLRDEYELSVSFLNKFEHPVVYAIGNHDVRNVGRGMFEELVGPAEGVYEADDYFLLVFDSTIPDLNNGRFGRRAIRRLRHALRDAPRDKLKLVMFHHHLLPIPNTGRERNVLEDAGTVLKTILDYDVDIVFNGHRHMPNFYQINTTLVSNAGGFSCHKVRAGGDHSFNVLSVYEDGEVQTRTYNIESRTKSEKSMSHRDPGRVHTFTGSRLTRIVHISDTHFTPLREFRANVFQRGVEIINRLAPDLVVHTGDVTHEGLPQDFEMAEKYLSQIDAPLLMVPGPHDMVHLGHELFEEHFCDLMHVYDGEVGIVPVDTAKFDDPNGLFGRDELYRVLERLREFDEDKPRLVMFHHHLVPIPNTREKHLLEDAGDVLRALVDERVDMILTGHRHTSDAVTVDDTVLVNANTFSSRRAQQQYQNTFNVIDITTGGLAVVKERNIATKMGDIMGIFKLSSANLDSD